MRAALLVFVIACGSEPVVQQAPAPAPVPVVKHADLPACAPIILNTAQRITTESTRLGLATTIDRTAAVMIASCEVEAWPASILACIASARVDADLDPCTEELTYRQHKRLHDKIAQVAPPKPTVVALRPPRPAPILITPPTATATVDCSVSILAPTKAACIKQYCQNHATDLRCMVE